MMAGKTLKPIPENTPVPELSTDDTDLGGPGGTLNQPTQALANQLEYLRQFDIPRITALEVALPDAAAANAAVAAAQAAAEAARDAAELSGGIYATVEEGLVATNSERFFSVPSTGEDGYLDLYLNSDGMAVFKKKSPSASVVADAVMAAAAAADSENNARASETTATSKAAEALAYENSAASAAATAITQAGIATAASASMLGDLASTTPGKGADLVYDAAKTSAVTAALGNLAGFQQAGTGALVEDFQKQARRVIYPENYGAVGDGITDDTAAFQAALNAASTRKMPLTIVSSHVIGEITLPSDCVIAGHAALGYDYNGNPSPPTNGPQLKLLPGAARMFNVTGINRYSITGLHLSSVGRTGIAISGGGGRGTISQCFIRGFAFGIGGNTGGGDTYIHTTRIHNTIVSDCDVGVNNPIDSYITNLQVNGCRRNIAHAAGANNTVYLGCRIEWSEEYGLTIFSCDHLRFIGCNFDRSGWSAFRCAGTAFAISIIGCEFYRSGAQASGNATEDNHIDLDGVTDICIIGGNLRQGADDNGGGYLSPARGIRINIVSANNVVVSGVSMASAATAGTLLIVGGASTDRPPNWRATGCSGLPDQVRQTSGASFDDGYYYFDHQKANPVAAGSANISLNNLPALGTYSSGEYTLRLKARNASSGASTTCRIPVLVREEAGPGATVTLGGIFTTTKNGTSLAWATSGTSGLVATVASPVNGGTGFVLTVANFDTNTQQIDAWLER